jgi:hypothetical protein
MKFLDLNGLNHFWTKIKASFGTAIVDDSQSAMIPFVANHQIVNINTESRINVYNWFQKASKGGILELIVTGRFLAHYVLCKKDDISYLYHRQAIQAGKVSLVNIDQWVVPNSNGMRLIKVYDDKLIVTY